MFDSLVLFLVLFLKIEDFVSFTTIVSSYVFGLVFDDVYVSDCAIVTLRQNAIVLEEKEKKEKELLSQIIEEAEQYKVEFYKKREITCENNKSSNREKEKVPFRLNFFAFEILPFLIMIVSLLSRNCVGTKHVMQCSALQNNG